MIENSAQSFTLVEEKVARVRSLLRGWQSVVVGFSGGVDSTLVAFLGNMELGERMLAVTVCSPVEVPDETALAQRIAAQYGFRHLLVELDDLEDPAFAANPPERCYLCKLRRFRELQKIARQGGFAWLADGSNADDEGDYRPGRRALAELGVRSPLSEAALSKAEIRQAACRLGLPNWDKPAAPCLATRFPYGTPITAEAVARIGRAEKFLNELGFPIVRVRYAPDTARIEVPARDLAALLSQREAVTAYLATLGFTYTSLDLAGYRPGSLNETLPGRLGRQESGPS